MKNNVNPRLPVHDGRHFFWEGKSATGEVSSIGAPSVAGRVWRDSCDVGFYVRSHKTGVKKLFVETAVTRSHGDVLSWTYESDDGLKIEIFND